MCIPFSEQKEAARLIFSMSDKQFKNAHKQAVLTLHQQFLVDLYTNEIFKTKASEEVHTALINYVYILIHNIDNCPEIIDMHQFIVNQYLENLSAYCEDYAKKPQKGTHGKFHQAHGQEKVNAGEKLH